MAAKISISVKYTPDAKVSGSAEECMTGTRRKYMILAVVALMFIYVPVSGQSEFENWLSKEKESFQQYKDQRDGEFVEYLKKQWEEFQVFKGDGRDDVLKPVKMPEASPPPVVYEPPDSETIVDKIEVPTPPVVAPEISKYKTEIPPANNEKKLKLDFYETEVAFRYDKGFYQEPLERLNQDSMRKYWDRMSQTDYDSFLSQALEYKESLKLNDWGYHNLIQKTGLEIYKGDRNLSYLFVWFVSTKSGYASRIGYGGNKLYLLMPSASSLYGIPYLTQDGKKFYSMSFGDKPGRLNSLLTYKGNYPKADKAMNYEILSPPVIKKAQKLKKLSFNYRGQDFKIDVASNNNIIKFYEFYPQTDLGIYFDASISSETEYTMLNGLKPLVEGKAESEAVGILLSFVQNAFPYKTDDGQFGREKYMLPEETVMYPYSDCEDRSFLFAYLVKKLVGLEVVGLNYPGHVATAVKFNGNVKGDSITNGQKRYIVCDPTYINASVGMAMPKFKNVEPKVIQIRS
jgi:hypothetical protein